VINPGKPLVWIVLAAVAVVGIGGLTWGISHWKRRPVAPDANASQTGQSETDEEHHDDKIPVEVVHPKKGSFQRLTTQPGSIQAWESVRLFAKVPGFLKKSRKFFDIGDHVKEGEILAVVDVPELRAQLKRNEAGVNQANARKDQMKARVDSAEAELLAANAAVTRAKASANSAAAWVRYRKLQYDRMKMLYEAQAIELKLVDEAKEHLEASIESELAAKETITANKAKVVAARAKIEETKADVKEAEAEIDVAQAELEKTRVQVEFSKIPAPFDGKITQRGFFPGDYIRSADEGSNVPLFTVQRTDKFRVIVQIPDRDVPYTDPGDDAFVQIDALPGKKLPAKVSRIADHEDPETRLMRVEIDLPNPTKQIKHGMYGQVTIILDQAKDLVSIPSSCLCGKQEDGKGTVYVVRDGVAHQVEVRLGIDNGLRVAVLGGLNREDQVILRPSATLTDGTEVKPTVVE
jgi:RND family efflux transporter MFP subunit